MIPDDAWVWLEVELPEIKSWVSEEAGKIALPQFAEVEVKYGQIVKKGFANAIVIRRISDEKTESDCVVDIEVNISRLSKVEITRDPQGWKIKNSGRYPIDVRAFKKTHLDPEAETTVGENAFSIQNASEVFEIKTSPRKGSDTLSEIMPVDAATETSAKREPFACNNIPIEISSPNYFWTGRETEQLAILRAIWTRVAAALKIPEPHVERGPNLGEGERKNFAVVTASNRTFGLSLPIVFAETLRQLSLRGAPPMEPAKLIERITWSHAVVIGQQTLALKQLRQLKNEAVVFIPADTAYYMDYTLDRRIRLKAIGNSTYKTVGDFQARVITSGGWMNNSEAAMDVERIPVLLQFVMGSKIVTVQEMRELASGQEIKINMEEGKKVSLAINGRILGEGTLAKQKEDAWSVKDVKWNV